MTKWWKAILHLRNTGPQTGGRSSHFLEEILNENEPGAYLRVCGEYASREDFLTAINSYIFGKNVSIEEVLDEEVLDINKINKIELENESKNITGDGLFIFDWHVYQSDDS